MAGPQSLDELKDWDAYKTFLKERIKLLQESEPVFISKKKIDFEIKGKPWKGRAILVGRKGEILVKTLKKEGVLFREGVCKKQGMELLIEGIPKKTLKNAELTFTKLQLGYTPVLHGTPPPDDDGEEEGGVGTEEAEVETAASGAPPPPTAAPASGAAQIEAELKKLVPAIKELVVKFPGWKKDLGDAVALIQKHAQDNKIADANKELDKLRKNLQKLAQHVYLEADFKKRGFDEKKAVQMANFAQELQGKGYDQKRAVMCAEVSQVLQDEGIPQAKAVEIGRMTNPKGKATVEDAKAAAKSMAIFPDSMLKSMRENGATVVSCRGPITDAYPDLKGVQPRGWPEGMGWDNVPGMYSPSDKSIVLGTMASGKDRKVPGPGEGPVTHGAFDLAGHEAGHGFDFSGGTPHKNSNAAFRKARDSDIKRLAKDKKDLGSYFMQAGSAGLEETFAESCARFYGGDNTMKADWTDLEAFWKSKPF